jgi:hypothetical protein
MVKVSEYEGVMVMVRGIVGCVTDRNECVSVGGYSPCSHGCSNSPGSFSCFCPVGMSLGADGRICKGGGALRGAE